MRKVKASVKFGSFVVESELNMNEYINIWEDSQGSKSDCFLILIQVYFRLLLSTENVTKSSLSKSNWGDDDLWNLALVKKLIWEVVKMIQCFLIFSAAYICIISQVELGFEE